MLSNFNKKKYLFLNQRFFLLVGIFVFYIFFANFTFAMTVPAAVYNGASFVPSCGTDAVMFDVPSLIAPMNCGDSISFGLADAVTYEVRDLDGNGTPIPGGSAFVQARLGAPGTGGCMNASASNYSSSTTYSDGSCTYNPIGGCMNSSANNYNASATFDDGTCSYDSNIPISAPSTVYNGSSFAPVCGAGAGVVSFDVPNAFAPQNCGDSITFGSTNATYVVRGLNSSGVFVPPSVNVRAIYNLGGGAPTNTKVNRTQNYFPIVSILFPTKGSFFSNNILINYKVTDQNDLGDVDEKTQYGLGDKPVSIFYTDKSFDWNVSSGIPINPDFKNLIVKDLSAIGEYIWSIKDLIPGNLYRIIIDATDNNSLTGESISDYFGVDFTPPVFKIKTDPTMVRTGAVTISVESSEDLLNAPIVSVTQKGGKPITVQMSGGKDTYQGSYAVQSGYDGTAVIDIKGTDLAGNVGTEITSGGTFSVGVNPPPKPIIISAINKTVTYEGTTTLSGTVRADTEVILSVNGMTTATIKPDSKGNFTFDNIKLDKVKNKGVNYLSVVSRDVLGTVSESANIEIKYNVAPTITIIKPTANTTLSGQTDIIVKGADENFDTLLYTYEIISLSDYKSKNSAQGGSALGGSWTTIATDIPGGSFSYDTTESDDGDYMIRVRVSDGYVTATSTPVAVAIKSGLAYFRFENGRRTITKEAGVTINGTAIIPSALVSTVSLKTISYSVDGGITWTNIKFDNTVAVTEQKFSVMFDNLSEGVHLIMWRIRDSRNLISKGNHTIIVDNTAPRSPIIKNPKNNSLITNNDDENVKKEGIQISVNGTAEAGTIASLVFNGQTLTTRVSLLGEFSFDGITLDKLGKQQMQFFATDEVGNISNATILNLTYNNPPVIIFINPKPFGGLSGKAVLSWNITDIDNDTIKNVEVSYRNAGGTFKTLVTDASAKGSYTWDTSNLPESGDYELKISASDSITPVSATTNFFIDRTPPTLLSFSIKKEMVNKKVNFSGKGTATDAVSGVEYVEYSIKSDTDKERGPWYRGIITQGYKQKLATFSIKYPNDLVDNSYTVYARAVDTAGNVSNELNQNIYIDRTAPRIGSFFIIKNNLNLMSDQYGNISFYKNSPFTFAVSIEQDTQTASLMIGNKNINLNKNIALGLWEATTISDATAQDIFITAEDDSGNITKNKKIGTLTAVDNGKVIVSSSSVPDQFISGVVIRISKYNEDTGGYDKYIPTLNGVLPIITTDQNGEYNLILREGSYHLSAVKFGYEVIRKDIVLSKAEIVNELFVTKKISGIMKFISDIYNNLFY